MQTLASDRARTFWPEILTHASVSSDFLHRKNGPCPFCGGKDRFRFVDRDDGLWVCSNCTEGKYANGMRFLMLHLGLASFQEVAAYIHRYFDGEPLLKTAPRNRQPSREASSVANAEAEIAKMSRLWQQAVPVQEGDPVWKYLTSRIGGLKSIPAGLRYHPELEYWEPGPNREDRPQLLGRFPAMLARGYDHTDRLVQLHRTYLTMGGEKAPVPVPKKTSRGIGVSAYALRIMPVDGDTLGVSEGIETGLAGALLYGVPVWPCYCDSSLAQFTLPDKHRGSIRKLMIFADHDERKLVRDGRLVAPGLYAAERLAKAARQQGLKVLITKTAKVNSDFADLMEPQAA